MFKIESGVKPKAVNERKQNIHDTLNAMEQGQSFVVPCERVNPHIGRDVAEWTKEHKEREVKVEQVKDQDKITGYRVFLLKREEKEEGAVEQEQPPNAA